MLFSRVPGAFLFLPYFIGVLRIGAGLLKGFSSMQTSVFKQFSKSYAVSNN